MSGMNIGKFSCLTSSLFCEAYIEDKQHRIVFPNEGRRWVTQPLETVHSNMCGPMMTTFMSGCKVFCNIHWWFQEMYGCICWNLKVNALRSLKSSIHSSRRNRSTKLRHFGQTMACNSFLSIHTFFEGLWHWKANVHPIYNSTKWSGRECESYHHGDGKEHASCSNLNKSFWAETVANAVYRRNQCPTRALDSITPEKSWSGKMPYIVHMCEIGCVAYAMMLNEGKKKVNSM